MFLFIYRVTALLAVVFCLLAADRAWAQAGPPLVTDDPGTPGNNHWEINTAFQITDTKNVRSYDAPLLDINYGVGEHVQITEQIPWVINEGQGAGLGTANTGVKWRFLDEEKSGLDMSTFPQVIVNNGTTAAARGLIDSSTEVLLPIEMASHIGDLEIGGEVGFDLHERTPDQWFYGVALGYNLTKELELCGEIRGNSELDFNHLQVLFNVGARWHFSEHVGLLGAVGTTVPESNSNSDRLLLYLALQFTF